MHFNITWTEEEPSLKIKKINAVHDYSFSVIIH